MFVIYEYCGAVTCVLTQLRSTVTQHNALDRTIAGRIWWAMSMHVCSGLPSYFAVERCIVYPRGLSFGEACLLELVKLSRARFMLEVCGDKDLCAAESAAWARTPGGSLVSPLGWTRCVGESLLPQIYINSTLYTAASVINSITNEIIYWYHNKNWYNSGL